MSLQQLKTIRQQRAKRVYIELKRARSSYEQAERDWQAALNAVENYKIWRIRQEKILFDELHGDYFSPDKLGTYHVTLDRLKQQEEQLTATVPEYERQRDQALQLLEQCKEALQNVNRDKEKVDEFIEMQEKEEKLIEEKQEENVADELSCFKSSRR